MKHTLTLTLTYQPIPNLSTVDDYAFPYLSDAAGEFVYPLYQSAHQSTYKGHRIPREQ